MSDNFKHDSKTFYGLLTLAWDRVFSGSSNTRIAGQNSTDPKINISSH